MRKSVQAFAFAGICSPVNSANFAGRRDLVAAGRSRQRSAGSGRNDFTAVRWTTGTIEHRWINGSTAIVRSIDIWITLAVAVIQVRRGMWYAIAHLTGTVQPVSIDDTVITVTCRTVTRSRSANAKSVGWLDGRCLATIVANGIAKKGSHGPVRASNGGAQHGKQHQGSKYFFHWNTLPRMIWGKDGMASDVAEPGVAKTYLA